MATKPNRSTIEPTWKKPHSRSSRSTLRQHREHDKQRCNNCLRSRVIYMAGCCQTCWRSFSREARALVRESYDRDQENRLDRDLKALRDSYTAGPSNFTLPKRPWWAFWR